MDFGCGGGRGGQEGGGGGGGEVWPGWLGGWWRSLEANHIPNEEELQRGAWIVTNDQSTVRVQ